MLCCDVQLTGIRIEVILKIGNAEVAELADALRSGRSGVYPHGGSTPPFGTGDSHQ